MALHRRDIRDATASLAAISFSIAASGLLTGPGADQVAVRIMIIAGLLVGCGFALIAVLLSDRARLWLDRQEFARARVVGLGHLRAGEYLQAALAFQEALTYGNSPDVRLGFASALDKLGALHLTLDSYRRAFRHASHRPLDTEVLATSAAGYARALWHCGGQDGQGDRVAAHKVCRDALALLGDSTNREVAKLRRLLVRLEKQPPRRHECDSRQVEESPMTQLNRFGHLAKEHLKEHRPKMYAELEASGQLQAFLVERQERATDVLGEMLHKGASDDQAWEVAREELFLPTEEDVPRLGEDPEPYTV